MLFLDELELFTRSTFLLWMSSIEVVFNKGFLLLLNLFFLFPFHCLAWFFWAGLLLLEAELGLGFLLSELSLLVMTLLTLACVDLTLSRKLPLLL